MRIRLLLTYDGTDFAGWQLQDTSREPRPTIQGALERAIHKVVGQEVRVHGSGRTDAGAHALGQVAHFDSPIPLGHYDLRRALGQHLPSSIVIRQAWEAPEDFHSLFSAKSKVYVYRILNREVPSALHRNRLWWVRRPLEVQPLNEMASQLLGRHNFKSFQTRGTPIENTERVITKALWVERRPGLFEFQVQANGFLKQMVRNLVGTMVDLQLRGREPVELGEILRAEDRRAALTTAPAHGLYLVRVFYPEDLDNRCRKI